MREHARDRHTGMAITAIGMGLFTIMLDGALVNAAFPAIVAGLGSSIRETSWVINAYNLSLTAGLVLAARIAERFGRRRVYIVGFALYALGCLACAGAPTLPTLIVTRAGLGLCAALLLPTSLALIPTVFAEEEHPWAVGRWAAFAGLGSIVGPLVGGPLLAFGSWRSVFVVGVPVCLVAATVAARALPARREPLAAGLEASHWVSGVLCGVTIAAVLAALVEVPQSGWASDRGLLSLGVALAGVGLLVVSESRATEPIMPGDFRAPSFTLPLLGTLLFGFAFGMGLLAIPLVVTDVQGRGFMEAAMSLAPASLSAVVAALASGRICRRLGYEAGAVAALALFTGLLFALGHVGPGSSRMVILVLSALAGLGAGLGGPTLVGWLLHAAGTRHASLAAAWYSACRQFAMALGVTTFAVLVSRPLPVNPAVLRQIAAPSALAGETATTFARAFFWSGMVAATGLVAWLAALLHVRRATS